MAKPVGEGRRRAARIEAGQSSRPGRSAPRGGATRWLWPARRRGTAARRWGPRGLRGVEGEGGQREAERERDPAMLTREDTKRVQRSRRRTSGAIRWRIGRPQIKG